MKYMVGTDIYIFIAYRMKVWREVRTVEDLQRFHTLRQQAGSREVDGVVNCNHRNYP